MRRYIVLLLITGIVWAQTDFDKLVLKNGTTYLGEFLTIDGDNVFFKPASLHFHCWSRWWFCLHEKA